MHYFLYTFLLITLILAALPILLWKYFSTAKYKGTIRQRFGFDLPTLPNKNNSKTIWLHAVSVGETLGAKGVVEKLKQQFPNHDIVLSTVTKTGQQVAKDKLSGVAATFYLPIDLPWVVNRVVAEIQPRFFVVMETELWPNLFHALEKKNIPVITINGRLSPSSFKNYARFSFFMKKFLNPVKLFAMQSAMDAQRMATIGGDSKKIVNTGNLKFDQAVKTASPEEMELLAQKLPHPKGQVWIAASTHPSEEEIVLAVFARLLKKFPTLKLILVPRHPERGNKIAEMIKKSNWSYTTIAEIDDNKEGKDWLNPILLVDKVGWLTRLYGYAKVAYIGGSLIPHGGQNMLEAAAWSIPPVFGPSTYNFQEASRQIIEADGGVMITDTNTLYSAIADLLQNEEKCKKMGKNAQQVVEENTGALDRTMNAIINTINKESP
ncbi:MAG: 3-deoxy-D-manno-octulosonic acid transferase [Magnetococcales bacterium]|nr:3-deoxy-D-manno-octulosonic acid transferase [Magnetococcales bacterium]